MTTLLDLKNREAMKKICNICLKRPSVYKKVNHCKICHSLYNKANYEAMKERMRRARERVIPNALKGIPLRLKPIENTYKVDIEKDSEQEK